MSWNGERCSLRRSLEVGLTSLVLGLMASYAGAQTTQTIVDCADQKVKIRNLTSDTPIDVVVQVIVSEYEDSDLDCDVGDPAWVSSVQVEKRVETGIEKGANHMRTLTFSDLGLSLPTNCDVYILTARTALKSNPNDTSEASCATSAAQASLNIVSLSSVAGQIQNDLLFNSKIDLTAIRPPVGGLPSCLGIREYAIQAINTSSTETYRVTYESKYVCSTTASAPDVCLDDGTEGVSGDGWNHVVHTDDVVAGECSAPVGYANDEEPPFKTLPSCCDTQPNAMQCTDFIVTRIDSAGGSEAVMPAFSLGLSSIDYRTIVPVYTCNDFFPTNEKPYLGITCFGDPDADGFLGSPNGPGTCDNCKTVFNPDQADADGDRVGDVCDNCPADPNTNQADADGDTVGDVCDNCPAVANYDQADLDSDGQGDACDLDDDNDGIPDTSDNCPTISNADQLNFDADSQGDACDADDDNDGVADITDNCHFFYNPGQLDSDQDGIGDACDPDAPCIHCIGPAGVCDGEAPGTPCGINPSCGGVCRSCGGNWGCFRS